MGIQKILVVDDNVEIQNIAREFLESEGFQVQCAPNGKEALELLLKGAAPDLILLDLVMPKMDGVEFMKIRKQNPEISSIPVILLSGMADEAQNVTPDARVPKPLLLSTLSKAIAEVMAKSKTA